MSNYKILRESGRISSTQYGKYGYGGNNRTQQITEILEAAKIDFQFTAIDQSSKLIDRLFNAYKVYTKHNLKFKLSKFMVGYLGHVYENYKKMFSGFDGEKIFLQEEAPSFLSYYVAKEYGFKIISLPHNIETMMIGYNEDFFTKEPFPQNIFNEIRHLGLSDKIFCIAKEEQWLLNNCRINADFLPYFPPVKKELEIQTIANLRKSTYKKEEYVIISTVENPATINSLETQLNLLSFVNANSKIKVRLIGYGTEKLRDKYSKFNFLEVEGTVEPLRLQSILSETRAVLIHQNNGPGALTKIPELLLSNIPIIANSHASRTYYNCNGLFSYEDEMALLQIIKGFSTEVACKYNYDKNYYSQRLIDSILVL